ncbi:MAG TPA: hypothetical protein VFE03_10160 [Caulobacteraceae bacterium]|nr:hypothetical protein [Caulobacteraceae bacterium]
MAERIGPGAFEGTVNRLTWSWGLPVVALMAAAVAGTLAWPSLPISRVFMTEQDFPAIAVAGVFWLVVRWAPVGLGAALASDRARLLAFGAAALTAAIGLGGALSVYHGYALSMDEFMANFDAEILRRGVLQAPVAEAWRPYINALQPIFRHGYGGDAAWSSNYLPVSAAFRGLFDLIGAAALTNALWAGLAVICTYGAARRMWPDRPEGAMAAAVLLATSSQVLVTAMTPYAMTAHLALNMAWLWLFLRRTPASDAAAAGVAALACGLHQVLFHPLFAAPFVFGLWIGRQWRRAAWYTAAYLLIALAWSAYWTVAHQLIGAGAGTPAASAAAGTPIEEAATLAGYFKVSGLGLMAKNLLRFVAWQNPLAIALAVWGLIAALKTDGVLRALIAGFVLTIAAMFVLMPSQGHGWGYRYVHGLLGSVCLVAAHAWMRISEREGQAGPAWAMLAASCAFSLLVLLPVRAWQVERWVAPYAAATRAIAAKDADVVIVDPRGMFYGDDLVRNDPFLINRPKVMDLASLSEVKLAAVCRRYRVSVFDERDGGALGIRKIVHTPRADARLGRMRAEMAAMRCG